MLGSDGKDVSDRGASGRDTDRVATLVAGGREMPAEHAAAEEKPGSLNVDHSPEGGGK